MRRYRALPGRHGKGSLRRRYGRVEHMAIFLRDCHKAVLYSSKAVIVCFVKLYILMSNAVRRHTQPMTGESRSER
jgi:hypothetical protein